MRVCVITAGHLATCPRMLKAADAFALAGHEVRVVSANYLRWAREADQHLRSKRTWEWQTFNYEKPQAIFSSRIIALRFRIARRLASLMGPERAGLKTAACASSRAHRELLKLAVKQPADFFYGGTSGGMVVAAEAGRKLGVPYALDLEDFHSAEQDESPEAHLSHALISNLEQRILSKAAFLTAGSEAIASAYQDRYGVRPLPVNNTFPLPEAPPEFRPNPNPGLRLYWFSQTIGEGRGLEEVVRALKMAGIPAELHLRGLPTNGYVDALRALATGALVQTKIIVHEPAPPDEMVRLAEDFEVGLAVEETRNFNRRICLTNKAFTYILAGLAVIFTNTPGQSALALDLKKGAQLYRPGDIDGLARCLHLWASDKEALLKARHEAWAAAKRRWHWEHPLERGALLELIAAAAKGP